MYDSLQDLMRFTAVAGDDRFAITEIFLDEEALALRYVALDIGGWFEDTQVTVAIDRFDRPDPEVREWPVKAAAEEIEDAPRWTGDGAPLSFLSTGAMPPLIVGPFGSTTSPLLLQAQAAAALGHDAQVSHDSPVTTLTRASRWLSLPAFGRDGELGRLVDALVDADGFAIRQLVIDTGVAVPGRQLVVDVAHLSHGSVEGTHVVLDMSADELEAAPELEHYAKVDRNWYDTLLTYYGLG